MLAEETKRHFMEQRIRLTRTRFSAIRTRQPEMAFFSARLKVSLLLHGRYRCIGRSGDMEMNNAAA